MNQNSMNIVIAINRRYIHYSYVMLTSLLINNAHPIDVFVLHRDLLPEDEDIFAPLSEQYPVTFHFCFISDELLPPPEVLASNSWGIETYFRLAIMDLLPQDIDRALYIDSDMIINAPLDELYYCDFGNKKIAACRDFISTAPFGDYRDTLFCEVIPDDFIYFNAGLTLFSLEHLRPDYCFRTYMETAKALNYQIQFPDQDLLNYCHRKDVLFFDARRYNLYARRAYTDLHLHYEEVRRDTTVIHYATAKPWQGNFLHCDIEQIWWDYAKETPFYYNLMEEALQQVMMDETVNTYVFELQQENQQLYQIMQQYEQILKKAGIS